MTSLNDKNKTTKAYEFCSWAASAALCVWPVLALAILGSLLYGAVGWHITTVVIVGVGAFVTFIVGLAVLAHCIERGIMHREEEKELRVVYKVLLLPVTLMYGVLFGVTATCYM